MSLDLFTTVSRAYGPPWRLSDEQSIEAKAVNYVLEILRWALKRQRRSVGPYGPIYCDLIDNPTFNAFATSYEQHEFITLLSGAVNHIYLAFFCFLSDPATLPTVGEASGESISKDGLERFKAHSGIVASTDVPQDFGRLTLARDLAIFTCLFILLHEVGHIVRCHPHFFRRKYGLSVYEEIPLAVTAGDLSRIRVAFEWEADESAAITSYQILRTLYGHPHFHGIRKVGADHAWAISVSMTFALIAILCGGDMLQESSSHPAAYHRYLWSMLSVEGAPECEPFEPCTVDLQNGFSDVVGWLKRNEIDVSLGTMAPNPDSLLSQLQERYASVNKALREESPLLDDLATERQEGATKWLSENTTD